MAEETQQKTGSWSELWAQAKEVVTAGVATAKDIASIRKTEAETKALNNQKTAPNWKVIGLVSVGVVAVVVVVVWLVKRK